jgi:antitoxin MazE
MKTKLVPIGNSYGIRLPKTLIQQFGLDKNNLEISIKENGIFISPISDVPRLDEWDRLFKEAKQTGFNAEEDSKNFSDWDVTLTDGDESL